MACPFIVLVQAVDNESVAADQVPPNAADGVQYIGSDQCIDCHKDQHQSFLRTMHSKAAQVTDVASEPPPSTFLHQPSGHRYEVAVDDGKMFHREHLLDNNGDVAATTEHQMVMTLGSGTHAKSYLSRKGEFSIESPITYYSDDKKWSMSPGYDVPSHRSFRRTVTARCVFCHVGSIQQIDENPYKFEILEPKIGCERCHGPGELHAKRHRENPNWSDDPELAGNDDSIVNPVSLTRELSESICQQCHCQGVQQVEVTDKDEWDFRPGLSLTDYRVDFQFRLDGDNAMRLVGHVEQMHESKCYTETETLTCITCHDPHDPPAAGNLVEYHRDKCFQCHDNQSCGKTHADRIAANGNDCAKCHMPRRDTNVSHFALHNHRIGIHNVVPKEASEITARFEPILDVSHLPDWEQQRLRGLAKYELHRRMGGDPKFATYNIEATGELIQVKTRGKADADVDAALVWLAWEQGQNPIAENIAREILKRENKQSMPRIVASHILAKIEFQNRKFPEALELYRSLSKMHRDGSDIYYLGLAEQNNRNSEKAIEALEYSLEIEPSQTAAHIALQAIYQSTGQPEKAEEHRLAAEQNQLIQQRQAAASRSQSKKSEIDADSP
ncbi:MAG: hypothetical protein HKN47_17545 [Pirellulaceae bacterium]|nr:hypothetical protein [Pirellulaceae bacterium]